MLALTRKSQQTIHIGENIVVRVGKIRGSTVTLGIEAPQEVNIYRGELKLSREDIIDDSKPIRRIGDDSPRQADG